MEARDNDSPEVILEIRWAYAYGQWLEHKPEALQALIREGASMNENTKEFFCALVAGKADRGKGGRRPSRRPNDEREIVVAVFDRWETSSREAAIAEVAQARGMTEDEVRGLVQRFREAGWTREFWREYLRPRAPGT